MGVRMVYLHDDPEVQPPTVVQGGQLEGQSHTVLPSPLRGVQVERGVCAPCGQGGNGADGTGVVVGGNKTS